MARPRHHEVRVFSGVDEDGPAVPRARAGHGVEHLNKAKTRLIKFLHEEMGFDVLAFESSLDEFYYANKQRDDVEAADLMRSHLSGDRSCRDSGHRPA